MSLEISGYLNSHPNQTWINVSNSENQILTLEGITSYLQWSLKRWYMPIIFLHMCAPFPWALRSSRDSCCPVQFPWIEKDTGVKTYVMFIIMAIFTNIQVQHIRGGQKTVIQASVPQRVTGVAPRLHPHPHPPPPHSSQLSSKLLIIWSSTSLILGPSLKCPCLTLTHLCPIPSAEARWIFLQSLRRYQRSITNY